MLRKKSQGYEIQGRNTAAGHEVGKTRSSDEVFVMKMERRGFPLQPILKDTRKASPIEKGKIV